MTTESLGTHANSLYKWRKAWRLQGEVFRPVANGNC
jgi:transposase-like protein